MSTAPANLEASLPAIEEAPTQPEWKRELNGKIAAVRARRLEAQQVALVSEGAREAVAKPPAGDTSRAARVAAAVAARYAQAPSYSEYLAAQELAAATASAPANGAGPLPEIAAGLAAPVPAAAPVMAPVMAPVERSSVVPAARPEDQPAPEPAAAGPLEEAWVTPAAALPARLLEFPRELVAARKARPRHAEGPLREERPSEPQLRIFEVASEAEREVGPDALSSAPKAPPAATEWSSIRLDALAPAESTIGISSASDGKPKLTRAAGLEDRLMAAIVDAALVGIAFLLFTLVFTASTTYLPTGRTAAVAAALVLGGLYLLYQLLFFSFSESTPGMLYARIALCTFDDRNPTRAALRKRIFAVVLAAMPLGLGFLYALFDEDRLGWHDRMTRTYQRSYK